VGDDLTDIDMFRAAAALSEEGVAACNVAVVSTEATPDLLEAADYSVEDVAGVEWLLAELLDAVTQTIE
jgi:hypothetical protein